MSALLQTMMSSCCKRRHNTSPHVPVDDLFDDEWDVITVPSHAAVELPQHVVNNSTRSTVPHLRETVKRIIKLLMLRKIHSRIGSWLNTSMSRTEQARATRKTLATLYATWPRTVLRRTACIFDHLERRRGILQYKSNPVRSQASSSAFRRRG